MDGDCRGRLFHTPGSAGRGCFLRGFALLGRAGTFLPLESSNGPTRECGNLTPNVTLAPLESRVNVTLAVGNVTPTLQWAASSKGDGQSAFGGHSLARPQGSLRGAAVMMPGWRPLTWWALS
jgi:hypothetical protein